MNKILIMILIIVVTIALFSVGFQLNILESIIWLLLLTFYMLPSIIAWKRQHSLLAAIVLTNIFFGITIVGWVISLIWSFKD